MRSQFVQIVAIGSIVKLMDWIMVVGVELWK